MGDITQKYMDLSMLQFVLLFIAAIILCMVLKDFLFCLLALSVPVSVLTSQVIFFLTVEHGRFFYSARAIYSLLQLIQMAILFFGIESSLIWMFIMQIIRDVIFLFVYLIKLGRIPRPLQVKWDFAKPIIIYGTYPMLAVLLQTLNYRVDIFMLKDKVTPESLGYYSFGVSVAELLWIIPKSFKEVLTARTAKNDSTDTVILSLKLSNMSMLVCMVLAALFGKLAIRICFGEVFVPAFGIMLILFAGIPSMSWYMIIGTVFNAQGRRKFFFFVMLGGLVANILLNIALIPIWGITGAAFTSIVSYTVCGGVFLAAYGRQIGKRVSELFFPTKADFMLLKKILFL